MTNKKWIVPESGCCEDVRGKSAHFSFLISHSSLLRLALSFLISHLSFSPAVGQPSDSLILTQLKDYGINFTADNSVTLLFSGQEKFDDMFRAIRQARHSVHLEYFNFRNDSIASLLFDILREKRREGVEVRALFDGFGNDSNNQPLKKTHVQALRNDSVSIYEFDPIRFPWVNHIWPRDHRKIVVIDGSVGYTGGMNVADYYIKGTEQVGAWRDMHCRLEGSVVNQLQRIFARAWEKVTGETITDSIYFRAQDSVRISGLKPDTTATRGHKLVGIVNREPGTVHTADGQLLGKHDAVRFFYVNAINDARDSIRIINPYFTLIPSVSRALKRALKRGVKVELMISAKSDIPLTPDCAFYNMHRMMKRGAHVWLYQPGFHHSKIMMVDGRFCTVGSTNLDARSLRFDYEENAVIIDRPTTLELDQMFDRDKRESVYLTPETWRQFRTPWQRFRGWFAHLLRPFL
ncbi:MAG: cardiolipin synthase [Prevotella sp.]|nr:cardiolipin synthase [Prevotella sp.]